MQKKDIHILAQKYLEAETTLEEERELKNAIQDSGKEHDDLRALFGYFEIQKTHTPVPAFHNPAETVKPPKARVITMKWAAIAASVAVLVVAIYLLNQRNTALLADTYSDPVTAAQSAVEALELLSGEINKGRTIAADQLKEFDNINKYLNIF